MLLVGIGADRAFGDLGLGGLAAQLPEGLFQKIGTRDQARQDEHERTTDQAPPRLIAKVAMFLFEGCRRAPPTEQDTHLQPAEITGQAKQGDHDGHPDVKLCSVHR